MQAAKDAHEKEKEKILQDLPESIKDMFGIIGFAPSEFDENDIIPVLVVNPYNVPPKPVRDVYWYDAYAKAKRSKKLSELPYLVYHYGADDPDDCYSFIDHDDFISYEEGHAKGYDILPPELQAKLDSSGTAAVTELTEEEQLKVRGLKELMEDVPKDPSERHRGFDFQERWEKLITEEAGPPASKKQKKK